MKNISFDILIRLKDSISAGVRRISEAMDSLSGKTEKASGRAERLQSVCDRLKVPNMAAVYEMVQRVGDSFSASAQTGMGFGQAMADLSAITGITGSDLERLTEQARRFGKESGLGADTAARAYTVLASQIQVAEIGMDGLNTLQEKSITLAQASGMSLDAAAEALAGTINQFGLGADQAERVINVLAAGSKYGAAEISELAQSFKVTGASASAMGLNVEETAGALEVLSKANLKGSEAGTALRNILLKLTTELGIDLGETSLEAALTALQPKLEDAAYLSKLFGAENIAAAQFLIKNAEAVGMMTEQLTGTGTAQEQAAIRTQTTAQKMAELRARVDDLKIGWTESAGASGPYFVLLAENAAVLTAVGGTVSVVWGWMTKLNAAVKAATGLTIAQKTAAIALSAAQKVAAAATGVWTVAQRALNVALKNNPIGWVCTVIAALTAGVVYAYNHFEGFRKVCDAVWATAKKMGSILWEAVVKTFDAVTGAARQAWEWVKRFLGIGSGEADVATESVNQQTAAIEANTEAKKKNKAVQIGTAGTKVSDMTYKQVTEAIEETEKKLKDTTDSRQIVELKDYNRQLRQRKELLEQTLGLNENRYRSTRETGETGSLSYVESRIQEVQTKVKLAVDDDSRRKLTEELESLERQKVEMELSIAPDGSLRRIEQEISYQRTLRETASAEERASIDRTLRKLEEKKYLAENASALAVPDNAIRTYEQMDERIDHYNRLLKRATVEERTDILRHIADLETVRKQWEQADAAAVRPQPVEKLTTIEELDNAIRYYQSSQQRQSAQEIQDTQRTVMELERKREALQRNIEVPKMVQEVEAMAELPEQELKVKIRETGFDGLTRKIRELQRMIDDTRNPLDDGMRADVERMIALYGEWRKQSVDTYAELKNGWSAVKGIGGGVDSITDSLKENRSAWQRVTGIIDGFLQLIDSIRSAVSVVKMLTAATVANTSANAAGATAAASETAAATASAAAKATEAAAAAPVILANKAETASLMELAAAKYFAAHASIPFAGFGIASGFSTAAVSMVQTIAAMPFAKGGVVSGPTFALVGEYSGAANNPEVIAPLDRLRTLIQPVATGGMEGTVEFRIKGNKLVGVLERSARQSGRS